MHDTKYESIQIVFGNGVMGCSNGMMPWAQQEYLFRIYKDMLAYIYI